jgi:uncharacterized protein YdhG (YjbR/CyaY superfamily)
MAVGKSLAKGKSAKGTAGKRSTGLTAEEKAAMRELMKERKANATREENLKALLDKIASMEPSDRAMGKRIHDIVVKNAPELEPKLWYGMPAYYKEGNVICFFQDAAKFKARYATFGFNDRAHLDEGNIWPTSWALTKLTAPDEAKIAALVKKAAS